MPVISRLCAHRDARPVFIAIAVILPPLATYGPKLAITLSVAAIAVLAVIGRPARALPDGPQRWLLIAGIALVAWGAASAAWSVAPGRSINAALDVAAILVGAIVLFAYAAGLDREKARRVPAALTAGLALALAVYLQEYLSDGYVLSLLHGRETSLATQFAVFNRGLALMSLLLWPVVLWLLWRRSHVVATVVAISGIAIVALYYGTSIKLALAGGILVAGIAAALPRHAVRATAALVVAALLLSPAIARLPGDTLNPPQSFERYGDMSVLHRLIIWDFASHRIPERWLAGWGLDAAREVPGADVKVMVKPEPNAAYRDRLSHHPHSAFLQVWLELGAVGVLLAALFLAALFETVHRRVAGRLDRAFVLGQIVTGIGVANLSFGLWQGWWLVGLVHVAVLTVLVFRALPRPGAAPPGLGVPA